MSEVTTMVMVFVPEESREKATEILFDIIQHGISAMRGQLGEEWLGEWDAYAENCVIRWSKS